MLKNMAKVLIVGAGMTGAASAALIRQHIPEVSSITIWDKGRGTGGRMSTARCPENSSITADLGAQYITLTQEYKQKRQSVYDELVAHGILSPMKDKIEGPNNFDQAGAQHFITPQGVSSLVKYFLKKSGADAKFQHTVSDITFNSADKVTVATKEGMVDDFDFVVLTLPVPQILQLKGSAHDCIEKQTELKQKLEAVSYSSRYALAMFFPPGVQLNLPWNVRYFQGDIRYMAVDQAKRGAEISQESGLSLVAHTGVPYGLNHLEDDMESVKADLIAKVRQMLPDLPQEMSSKIQRWRYSQIFKGYEGSPGCVCLSSNPPVILAGDAFSHSNFDGCMDSAEAVVENIQHVLKGRRQTAPTSGL